MDLVVIIILTVGLGLIRINQYGDYDGVHSFVDSDVSVKSESISKIPIGNNLMLKKEVNAFEKILIDLRLKR